MLTPALVLFIVILIVMFVRKSKKLFRTQVDFELFRTVVDDELKRLSSPLATQLRYSIEEYINFDLNEYMRIVPIKKSIRNISLAEVLAKPPKFPILKRSL